MWYRRLVLFSYLSIDMHGVPNISLDEDDEGEGKDVFAHTSVICDANLVKFVWK